MCKVRQGFSGLGDVGVGKLEGSNLQSMVLPPFKFDAGPSGAVFMFRMVFNGAISLSDRLLFQRSLIRVVSDSFRLALFMLQRIDHSAMMHDSVV
jgi:hypothetical protein